MVKQYKLLDRKVGNKMATGLKSRVIYKEHTVDGTWAGTYKLMLRAKTIPSPVGERNMVDVSTLEDEMEVQEMGRRASASVAIQGAYDKENMEKLYKYGEEKTKLDCIILYGTDGIGSIGKLSFVGQVDASPDEASDDHLTMTATIAVSTVPEMITDDYTVTVTTGEDNELSFTVAKKTE